MNYEIVNLEEKYVEGLKIRTANNDPNGGTSIGNLWMKFHTEGIYSTIKNKVNEKAIGLYTNYSDERNNYNLFEYDFLVCCEKRKSESISNQTVTQIIPAGKYAKFVVKGHAQTAIIEFWNEFWKMKLDRKFNCDFEEYQNSSLEDAIVHIYISLN